MAIKKDYITKYGAVASYWKINNIVYISSKDTTTAVAYVDLYTDRDARLYNEKIHTEAIAIDWAYNLMEEEDMIALYEEIKIKDFFEWSEDIIEELKESEEE